MKEQYSLFIGRWQPLHEGHKYIFNERLKLGKSVCIAIRDVEPNENQPWTAEEIKQNIEKEYQNLIILIMKQIGTWIISRLYLVKYFVLKMIKFEKIDILYICFL